MKIRLYVLPLLLAVIGALLQSCNDDETYADKRDREDKQIKAFLSNGVQIKNTEGTSYLLNIPGNIQVISESQFERQDSTTDVSKNQYVYFDQSGVYMQIVHKGTGQKIKDGESLQIVTRYVEYNIAGDSIQSSNITASYEMRPDAMTCSNSSGTFTGTFLQGAMNDTYSSSAVPGGWLIPLTYINIGRLDAADAYLAEVNLIVPSTQGHANASSNVYPCFYHITYERGR